MFLALSIFLGSNSHLVVFELLAESFYAVPVDHVVNPINGTKLWLQLGSGADGQLADVTGEPE